jgi:spermidine synthase
MNNDNEELFWEFIKKSGKECDNINKVRTEYKQNYSNDVIKSIDSIFNKYYSLIWAKLEPILGNIYTEDSNGFRNFVFYILSKGKHKLEFLLNKTYNKRFFKDVSKFSVEYKIEDILFEEKSDYQLVQVFKTKNFGNMLVIDNDVQLTESDERNYHEMIAHVPINYFNRYINVLIIGGGDGGTAREVLKHSNVKKVIMVDIDKTVIKASTLHFPNISPVFDNPRLQLVIGDGAEYVKNYKGNKFDVVIIDSTDFNQAIPLFTTEFYENVKKIINNNHMVCFNADNLNWNEKNIVKMVEQQRTLFKFVNPYGVYIPTFAGGYYSFCVASNSINPIDQLIDWEFYKEKKLDLIYYNHKIHTSSFTLPNKLDKKLAHTTETIAKGVHYIIDFEEMPFELINNSEKLQLIFKTALDISKMTILETKIHKFEPQGLTGFYLLSESHLSYHSWPEKGMLSLDLYTCGDFKLGEKAIKHILENIGRYPYKLKKIMR